MRNFRLFPADYSWWKFEDYESLLTAAERFRPRRVLEFGPGGSTLALVEGGATSIDSCEDDAKWLETYSQRIGAAHGGIVRFHAFVNGDPVSIPALDGARFDLAFIDGPKQTPTRLPAIRYAQAHADVVLCHDVETMRRLFDLRIDAIGTVGVIQP